MKKIFILLLFFILQKSGLAQDCILDPTFGIGGKTIGITDLNNSQESRNIIVQPDGKIIQLGSFQNVNSTDFLVIRYKNNGGLDSAFGTNGKVITSFGQRDHIAQAVALQSDGKIVVAGNVYNSNYLSDFALARYNSNGSLDSSFGSAGKLIAPIGLHDDFAYALSIQSDGKIIVAGSRGDSSTNIQAFAVVRFNSNGSIDNSFGQNGKIISHLGHFITSVQGTYFGQYYHESANSVAVQPDGKIVVAGSSYGHQCEIDYYGGVYCQSIYAMVRYNSNGSVDNTFGSNGKVTDSLMLNYPSALVLQTDGKIVVTGSGSQSGFITERYNSDGSLDNSFGTGGKTFLKQDEFWGASKSLALMPDGKIVLAGYAGNNIAYNGFALVRYSQGGKLDSTFKRNGILVFHLGPSGSYSGATGVAFQGNKIIAGGTSNKNQNYNIGVVRLRDTLTLMTVNIKAEGPVNFCSGGSVKLSTNITGTLQWYSNNIPIYEATDTVYTATTNGSYTVSASNAFGCGVSDAIVVTVNVFNPYISWNGNLNFCQGGNIILTTNASDSLQWFRNSQLINGATAVTYNATASGTYTVGVSKNGCLVISDPVVVTVENILPKPVINRNRNLEFCQGANVRLSSTVTGFIKWYVNGVIINGATDTAITVTNSGSYTMGVSNSCGSTVSDPVVVTVSNNPPKPSIVWNSTYFFSATAGYAHYQWFLNNVAIPATDTVNYKPLQTGLYKVQVTNTAGCSSISDAFNLVVLAVSDISVGTAQLRYYPNPAQTILNVDVRTIPNKKLIAVLYDLEGRELMKRQLNQTHNQLSLEQLPSGLYQLVIKNGTERITVKLMVIK